MEEYRAVFIDNMRTEEGVTDEGVKQIDTMFERSDAHVAARLSSPEHREEQCSRGADNQALMDRGAAGDFTGQI